MIVQKAEAGPPHFVIRMADHTDFAGRVGRAFGNGEFDSVEPFEEMIHVISHHDAGWAGFDAKPAIDPDTGLPYSLVSTPYEERIKTTAGSPDFNAQRHPYCELLSSMHCWGLYHGRYGLVDTRRIDTLAGEELARTKPVLDAESRRQSKLKHQLRADPKTAAWVADDHLFQNYYQLQFCDTLALYFMLRPEGARAEATFPRVPKTAADLVDITVKPVGGGAYSFAPFPFAEDGMTISYTGRWMEPALDADKADAAAHMAALPATDQTLRFVAG